MFLLKKCLNLLHFFPAKITVNFGYIIAPRYEKIFAYAKTETQLFSDFVFATRIEQPLYFLNPKFQAFRHLLWLYSPVNVGPGRKPRRPVFSQRGSFINRNFNQICVILIENTKSVQVTCKCFWIYIYKGFEENKNDKCNYHRSKGPPTSVAQSVECRLRDRTVVGLIPGHEMQKLLNKSGTTSSTRVE